METTPNSLKFNKYRETVSQKLVAIIRKLKHSPSNAVMASEAKQSPAVCCAACFKK